MSSDEEQQTVNPDDDDVNFQLNPFDHQSDQSENNNEEEDSAQGELEQSGENFINKLVKNGDDEEDENDTQNENETAPDDGQDENNDQETKPDENDDQEGDKKIDDNLKETGEKLIGKLTGESDKQNDKETAPNEENDQQNENETTPDDNDDQQNENATSPDDEDDQKNENETTPDNDNDDDKKDKKSGKGSKKSNNSGRAEKASQNMINQLIGGEDEHQTADGFHSKSNDEGGDEKSDTEKEKSDDSDDEKEKSDDSDDEKEKSEDSDDEKDNSDNESEKDDSDKEKGEKDPNDSLDDDFDDDGDADDPSMMITEASNVIKPPKSPKQHTARKKPSFPPQPNYSDEEIMEQIQIMMKDKKLPDTSYHQPIRNYISREQFEASEKHDYQRAELLESYLDMLTDLLNQIDNSEQEEERRKSIEEKIQKVNEHHQEFVRRWNKEWNDKTEEQEKTQKSIEERQELEINDFKKRCKEESFIQKFNKPSQTLINLRKAENQMAMSKLFDRAKALKKKADELQKIEQMEAQKKMNDNVLYQYQLIESRHEHERECFEQHNRSIFETLEKKRDKEQRNYEMAIAMLKAQLDPPPNKDRVELIKPQTAKRPIRNNRTIKNIRTPAALEIQSVDFSKFTRTRKIIKPTTASGTSRRNTKK